MTVESRSTRVSVPFVVRGRVSEGVSLTPYGTAAAGSSALELNELVWPGHLPVPLSDVPTAEIIELLSRVGDWVRRDPDGVLAGALESLVNVSGASRPL